MTERGEKRNEWNETLEQTVDRSKVQGGLLVYSLVEDEVIKVGINGVTPEGIDLGQGRELTARATGLHGGVLEIVEDTAEVLNWTGLNVCLGSIGYSFAGIEFNTGGLLRGYITKHSAVAVDLAGNHFRASDEVPDILTVATGQMSYDILMAEYDTLFLEDHMIF